MLIQKKVKMNNYKKILSIVIPTYNMEMYLHRCLDSLLISKNELLEVLIVNDGSKDSSLQIAREYEKKYPQTFRTIDKENGNYGSCVNRGLKEATGKYIKILDADDYFDTRLFSLYIDFLLKTDVDLVLSDFNMVNNDGKVLHSKTYSSIAPETILIPDSLLAKQDIWMHAVAYRTENLKLMGYVQTEGISYTDQEWIFLPMTTVASYSHFAHPLYNYVIGREGQTVDKKVHAKNFHQEVKGLMVMSSEYCSIAENELPAWAGDYLQNRILYRCNGVYSNYLFLLREFLDLKELVDIDHVLKKDYKPVYDLSNNHGYSVFRYHYIRDWRVSNFQETLKLKLYRLYLKARN